MRLSKSLIDEIRGLIHSARVTVARGVDLVQVYTNFEIGRRIIGQEQRGKGRAAYGQEVLTALSRRLVAEYGRGYSRTNLEYMRRFFLLFRDWSSISQSVIGKLPLQGKSQTVSGKSFLCRQRNKAIVEITLPKGANIHASEYQLYMPSKALLQRKLIEWTKELIG